jgi:P-type Cu2+ transporter
MSCCAPGAEGFELGVPASDEVRLASRALGDGKHQTFLSVAGVHCGACITAIEKELSTVSGIEEARVNLSTKRVSIRWNEGCEPNTIFEKLARIGYPASLIDLDVDQADPVLSELLRALAVSGFAAGNIMLLSVSVWAGAEAATRDLFHWVSALIAIPALVFAGRVFFRSAWNALRHGRMNMDVPISLGVSLAFIMSIYETATHGEHAYFDAAATLLFFLLIGRTLDYVMREKARTAVKGLVRLSARGANVRQSDGSLSYLPVGEIKPGMMIVLTTGERVPVDALVVAGVSEIDASLATGESLPVPVSAGHKLVAGTMNLNGALEIKATALAEESFLAEMVRMMEAAESGRSGYRRIADRAAALYAPMVHLTALLTFIGWMWVGASLYTSLTIAIAVLIITCPCALGLAVPIVQVMAAQRLFAHGIMIKDGAALERLAEVDTVLFDKTGTLTLGRPWVSNLADISKESLSIASAMSAFSRHPISIAIYTAGAHNSPSVVLGAPPKELPGLGLEAIIGDHTYRLGRAEWAIANGYALSHATSLSCDGILMAQFETRDQIRAGAANAVRYAHENGKRCQILSGDVEATVAEVAATCGIKAYRYKMLPSEKVAAVHDYTSMGHKTLMVGDGLNDMPAFSAAHVSMATATAADIGRNAADFVLLHETLDALPIAHRVALKSAQLIRENFILAIGYNVVAVPIAILGYVTPLVAAIAMSLSSIIVVANSMRLIERSPKLATPKKQSSPTVLAGVTQ